MGRTTPAGYLTLIGCFGGLVAMLVAGLNHLPNLTLGLMAFSLANLWAFTSWGVRRSSGLCPCCLDTINDPNHDWLEAEQ